MVKQTNKVFISCGQRTGEEKELGKRIQELVRELTPFEPYFAEFQTSLDGLSKNIFSELYKCKGFITVMHRRGTVSPGDHSRASVWVEQEIAIAAFINEVLENKIKVMAFAESGIELEGVREQLLLNPTLFTSNSEVIDCLTNILPEWGGDLNIKPPLSLLLKYETKKRASERHDYNFVVHLKNNSHAKITDYHVDLNFPRGALPDNTYMHEQKDRSSSTHLFLRAPIQSQMTPIYPGDSTPILRLNYHVDDAVFRNKAIMNSIVTATLYSQDRQLDNVEMPFNEIQEY